MFQTYEMPTLDTKSCARLNKRAMNMPVISDELRQGRVDHKRGILLQSTSVSWLQATLDQSVPKELCSHFTESEIAKHMCGFQSVLDDGHAPLHYAHAETHSAYLITAYVLEPPVTNMSKLWYSIAPRDRSTISSSTPDV